MFFPYISNIFFRHKSCIICNNSSTLLVKVKERLLSLTDFCQQRNEETIYKHFLLAKLKELISLFSRGCRKLFNNNCRISKNAKTTHKKNIRRSFCLFSWKMSSFLCSSACHLDQKNPSRRDWHLASTKQLR